MPIIKECENFQIIPRGRRDRDRMAVGFIKPPMQSMPITTKVVSSNPSQARCARYNIM